MNISSAEPGMCYLAPNYLPSFVHAVATKMQIVNSDLRVATFLSLARADVSAFEICDLVMLLPCLPRMFPLTWQLSECSSKAEDYFVEERSSTFGPSSLARKSNTSLKNSTAAPLSAPPSSPPSIFEVVTPLFLQAISAPKKGLVEYQGHALASIMWAAAVLRVTDERFWNKTLHFSAGQMMATPSLKNVNVFNRSSSSFGSRRTQRGGQGHFHLEKEASCTGRGHHLEVRKGEHHLEKEASCTGRQLLTEFASTRGQAHHMGKQASVLFYLSPQTVLGPEFSLSGVRAVKNNQRHDDLHQPDQAQRFAGNILDEDPHNAVHMESSSSQVERILAAVQAYLDGSVHYILETSRLRVGHPEPKVLSQCALGAAKWAAVSGHGSLRVSHVFDAVSQVFGCRREQVSENLNGAKCEAPSAEYKAKDPTMQDLAQLATAFRLMDIPDQRLFEIIGTAFETLALPVGLKAFEPEEHMRESARLSQPGHS